MEIKKPCIIKFNNKEEFTKLLPLIKTLTDVHWERGQPLCYEESEFPVYIQFHKNEESNFVINISNADYDSADLIRNMTEPLEFTTQNWIDGKFSILWEDKKNKQILDFFKRAYNLTYYQTVGGYLYYDNVDKKDHAVGHDNTNLPVARIDEIDAKLLPEKWSLLTTPENLSEVKDLFTRARQEELFDTNGWSGNSSGVWYSYDGLSIDGRNKNDGTPPFTIVTIEQLKQHYLKENKVKKVIGYKAPVCLFKGRIPKGSIFSEKSKDGFVMYNKDHMNSGVPTELVESWEAAYEPDEFKVGDWVTCIEEGNKGAGWKNGLTYKVTTVEKVNQGIIYFGGKDACGVYGDSLRAATKKEIENAQTISIAGYKAFFSRDKVTFGCSSFNKSTIEDLLRLMNKVDVEFKIGEEKVEIDTLQKILKQLK